MHEDDYDLHYELWQKAEQRASGVERQLFDKLYRVDGVVTQDDLRELRGLREHANDLLRKMLDGMRSRVAALKASGSRPLPPQRQTPESPRDVGKE